MRPPRQHSRRPTTLVVAAARRRAFGRVILAIMVAWLAISALLYVWPAGAELTGRARVVDGDTLQIGSTMVRLFGIDAPRGKQTCFDARGRRNACGHVGLLNVSAWSEAAYVPDVDLKLVCSR